MAWVRVDDTAMQHPKLVGLSDSAFRLWIKGLCYCQTYLTDGLIPREALRGLNAGEEDVEALSRPIDASYSPLWDVVEGVGFRVHDYLHYNDSREKARERQANSRARKERWIAASISSRTQERVPERVPNTIGGTRSELCPNPTQPNPIRERDKSARFEDSKAEAATAKVAGEFCERYSQIYSEERHGARYPVREARDFPIFMTLAKTWPDAKRLEDMFRVFLHLPAKGALNAQGTPAQFLHHAAECDSLLRQNGR